MATKRLRNGVWHFTVRRTGVLPKPVYFSFADEGEGMRDPNHANSLYTVEAVAFSEAGSAQAWIAEAALADGISLDEKNPLQREWEAGISGVAARNSSLAQPHGKTLSRSAEDVLSLAQRVQGFKAMPNLCAI